LVLEEYLEELKVSGILMFVTP